MTKMLCRRGVATLLTFLALAVVGVGQAAADNVLRYAWSYDTFTLDPIKTVYGGDITVQGAIFERLLQVNADGTELRPGLAESWDVSDDGLVYTFHLRDAKFSDGTTVTADDVVYSYTRLRDSPDSAFPSVFHLVEMLEALDSKTVRMSLRSPSPGFLSFTEMWNAGIVSKAAIDALGEEAFARQPVGAGPFRLKEWLQGDRVVLERNPHYWQQGKPYLDGVEFLYVTDDNTRISMLQAGEVDAISDVPWSQVEPLRTRSFHVPLETSTALQVVVLNHAKEPFNDVRIRRAFAYGIDIDAIIKAVTLGHAQATTSLYAPALHFFNTEIPRWPHDPEKAKALLVEAGKSDVEFELQVSAGDSQEEQIAVLIQAQLASIGFKVNIAKVDPSQAWERLLSGEYTAWAIWWYNETLDPDGACRWAFWGEGPNLAYYTRYNNPRVNELVETGAIERDQDARRSIYFEIQKLVYEEVAQIGLFYRPYRNGYSPRVENLIMNPAIQFNLVDARLRDE